MKYSVPALEVFLKKPLPEIPEEIWTFLDIAGFPNYENVLSNIYAHYLDKDAVHSLDDLFLQSLFNIVRKKASKTFESKLKHLDDWKEWIVLREESIEGKRIDILLEERSEKKSRYVIIENKVYADLYNPLDTYWSYTNQKSKVGIVLSLNAETPNHKGFINVTHEEFMLEVKSLLGNYIEDSQNRDIVILRDLMLNLNQQLNQPSMDKELIKFYHENRDKIESIYSLRGDIRADLLKQVESIGEQLNMDIKAKGARWYRTLIDDDNKDLHLSFCFYDGDESDSTDYISIQLEAKGSTADILINNNKLKSLLKKYSKQNILDGEDFKSGYLYIAYKGYSFEDIDFNPENLLFMYEKDWKPFIDEIKSIL